MPVFHLVMTFLPLIALRSLTSFPPLKKLPCSPYEASWVLVPVSRILAAEMFVELNNKKMFF